MIAVDRTDPILPITLGTRVLNVDWCLVGIGGQTGLEVPAFFQKAREFFAQFQITINFNRREGYAIEGKGGRDFVALQDWKSIGLHCADAVKGCDLFIVGKMELVEGHQPFGVTILPGKQAPEGIPQSTTGVTPVPNPTRPAIILNSGVVGQMPVMTLAHEIGHALLNTLSHHSKSGNFMFAEPMQQGMEATMLQIARMRECNWLA